MHAAALIAALLFAASGAAPLPVVEQDCELISVAHLSDGAEIVFFWADVNGIWTCLDHRWAGSGMVVSGDSGNWLLQWQDDGEDCYRIVRTPRWVESWESENPLSDQNQRPWFRQLLHPGLKQPPKLASAGEAR